MSKTDQTQKKAKALTAPPASALTKKPQSEPVPSIANGLGAGQDRGETIILHDLDPLEAQQILVFRRILERERGCNTPVEELVCGLVQAYGWNRCSTPEVLERCDEFKHLAQSFEDEAIAYVRHNPQLLDKLLDAGAPEGR